MKIVGFNKEYILTFKLSTSYPSRKFVYFVWISEQTGIFLYASLTDCFLEAQLRRSEFAEWHCVFKDRIATLTVATGLSTQRLLRNPESLQVYFLVDKVVPLQDLIRGFRVSPVSIISPVLHTHLHRHTDLARKTNGRNLQTFTPKLYFGHEGAIYREVLFINVKLYLENTDTSLTAVLIWQSTDSLNAIVWWWQ